MADYDPTRNGYIDHIRKKGFYIIQRRFLFLWVLQCRERTDMHCWLHTLCWFRTREQANATFTYMKLTGFEDVNICL